MAEEVKVTAAELLVSLRERFGCADFSPTFGEAGWALISGLFSIVENQEHELAELRHFRAVVCKAAVWFAQPGSDAHMTGFPQEAEQIKEGEEPGHVHGLLIPEAREAVAELASLDPSLWERRCEGVAPDGGSLLKRALYDDAAIEEARR